MPHFGHTWPRGAIAEDKSKAARWHRSSVNPAGGGQQPAGQSLLLLSPPGGRWLVSNCWSPSRSSFGGTRWATSLNPYQPPLRFHYLGLLLVKFQEDYRQIDRQTDAAPEPKPPSLVLSHQGRSADAGRAVLCKQLWAKPGPELLFFSFLNSAEPKHARKTHFCQHLWSIGCLKEHPLPSRHRCDCLTLIPANASSELGFSLFVPRISQRQQTGQGCR